MTNELRYAEGRKLEWPDYMYSAMGALVGALVAVPAIIGGMVSMNLQWPPRVAMELFPVPFMMVDPTYYRLGWPEIACGLAQYPAYGLLIGVASIKGRGWGGLATAGILTGHVALAVVCVVHNR